ncbi:hypothetical protein [Haloferax sp. ATB1]|uniref:hypothetical protein n=1 Tax=Haloferax sp. ATB1 TaxID=1508454 RepID=UPI0009E281AE|nr:hypothetical protein [Haloferax sp. ATB1]
MIPTDSPIDRRTVLRTLGGVTLASVAGCLDSSRNSGTTTPDQTSATTERAGPLSRIAVEEQAIVVETDADAPVEQVNLIQPNGELFGKRGLAAGARQVSFEIGTAYEPGEYRVVALDGEETVAEGLLEISPQIEIQDVGLFRNVPDKPWDEVYGDTETDRLKNGEAVVTVENHGTGPDAVVELIFAEDVPNPISDPRGSGMYETEQVIVAPGETVDLFSNSFPFGSESEKGMGCSSEGNSGQFRTIIETRVDANQVSKSFDVTYSGSNSMSECEVTITEA